MDGKNNHKEQIDRILISGKAYCDPDFSAAKLAELIGVTVFQLSRILRKEYGTSYPHIVHTHRILDAKRHLKDKRYAPYSIDDIGALVGFKNRQSFFAAFKKATGTTPEKFRQM
ncbi:MAG: AraC family transcriptional regulator [Bacteroidaceae bacterium]|nr:AraC family transcriptional regulator [Bacteroidaceae bacterium]